MRSGEGRCGEVKRVKVMCVCIAAGCAEREEGEGGRRGGEGGVRGVCV